MRKAEPLTTPGDLDQGTSLRPSNSLIPVSRGWITDLSNSCHSLHHNLSPTSASVCSILGALGTFIVLYNHRLCLVPEHLRHPRRKPCPHYVVTIYSLLPSALGNQQSSVSTDLSILDISYEWMFLCGLLSLSITFSRFIHVVAWVRCHSFLGLNYIPLCIWTPIYPFIC